MCYCYGFGEISCCYFAASGRDCVEADCQSHRECGENARCQFSRTTDKYQCECNSGFQGDGQLCTPTCELSALCIHMSRITLPKELPCSVQRLVRPPV